ncbi:MAG TPA: hypothetical protein VEY69_04390 [Lautropia sp.]|nr:hypothetical protein [Lautropia sp.]
MSLAFLVDLGGSGGESRITAASGVLMSAALLLAALEQYREAPGSRWWLAFACALCCAGWCYLSCRQSNRRRPMRLQATGDGMLRLSCLDSGESVDAAFVRGWSLGQVVWLHLRPLTKVDPAAPTLNRGQSASSFWGGDCRFLLTRRSSDEADWHALRRWLVWRARSRRREAVAT